MQGMNVRRAVMATLTGLALSFSAYASDLEINQFRVRGPAGGNDEFVELINAGPTAIDVSGYKLNASNASGTVGTRLTLPAGTRIAPGCHLLLTNAASSGYSGSVAGDLTYNTGVTDTGGLAILDASGTVLDQVGLSSGSAYQAGTPLASLGSSNSDTSYIRTTNAAGLPNNSGDNSADFVTLSPSAPHNSASPCVAMGASVSIADASATVTGAGDVQMPFTVTLSEPAPAGSGVTVHVATADDTASAAAGDYDALDTDVTVAPGASSASFDVTVHGSSVGKTDRTFTVSLSHPSGGYTLARASAIGAILYDIPVNAELYEIQGREQTSPLLGKRVITHDNVVTAVGPAGFTMQTPDARADADPLTSNGLYVFTGSAPTVAVGDMVDVNGRIDDYYHLTELKNPEITVVSHGARLPRAVEFDAGTPSMDPDHLSCGATNFQCFMSMRVRVRHGMINTGNKRFSGEPYAEVSITANGRRSLREPGVVYGVPVPAGVDLPNWDGNPEVFKMNTADFGAVPLNTPFNAGSTFEATGVISYDFGAYTLIPTTFRLTHAAELPRPVDKAPPVALRIGALNTERFCDSTFDTTYTCSGGSSEPTEAEVQLKIERLSAYIGGVLRLPDVLSVEEVKNLPLLQRLAKQLGDDYGVSYDAYLMEGHDPSGIDVGFLVRTDRVKVLSVRQLAADETWDDNGSTAYIHDHPPLLLTAQAGLMRFQVISVHTKARQKVDGSGSATDRDREKRFLQAKSIATQVQLLQQASPLTPLMVVGDFNSYQFSDGFVDMVGLISGRYQDSQNLLKLGEPNIVHPALWNAVESVPSNDRYSFQFTQNFGEIQGYTKAGSGNSGRSVPTFQVLDHALLNLPARWRFMRMQYGRADLDAPVQTADDAASASGIDKAIGVSDHDGFVVELLDPSLMIGHGRGHDRHDDHGKAHGDRGHHAH
ncbi:lamin tail domain-containing protein [Dyella thiooxydans]|uniref:lamin tail domain-containing protein n=1 Tax=Dyella thiooxydans TaxID=445710 RepID=UPI0007C4ACA0|nr:lamin tail domain-containing protein [Dyella thiooxydans]